MTAKTEFTQQSVNRCHQQEQEMVEEHYDAGSKSRKTLLDHMTTPITANLGRAYPGGMIRLSMANRIIGSPKNSVQNSSHVDAPCDRSSVGATGSFGLRIHAEKLTLETTTPGVMTSSSIEATILSEGEQ